MSERLTRIAIVNDDHCKPTRCQKECFRFCPVVKMGKKCIEFPPTFPDDTRPKNLVWISEELCNGCGICVKKCPFNAISIINLPKSLEKNTTHRYGPNSFKLHRLPLPRAGVVLGLVGTNGIGKSTALKILAGKLKPNLGRFETAPDWNEIITTFRGSELQHYFTRLVEDDMKAIIKPQYVDLIPRAVKGEVGKLMAAKDERGEKEKICRDLGLNGLQDRLIENLSGGELQRFAIGSVCIQKAEIYMFDEPSSYLDVKQRIKAAQVIRSLLQEEKYLIVVEHDLSILDFLSDSVCCLYGEPGAYGVITAPFGVREGINIFLAGFIPTENLRFRDVSLSFKIAERAGEVVRSEPNYRHHYPDLKKSFGQDVFELEIKAGDFTDSEIIVMLGENGTGKTTFIRLLAGLLQSDNNECVPELQVSYKPQKISPKIEKTVRSLFQERILPAFIHPQFRSDVLKPLKIEPLLDQMVTNLSGGELQRVGIVLCLGKPADVYLIDEPSAYLDSEQRIIAASVIKRFILNSKKTAFIVEHDFMMAAYLADRIIVFEGTPSRSCVANPPQSLLTGMNTFLMGLGVTFRRDPTNFRPRINKLGGVRDREQKKQGNYFYLDD